jgi:hypothetical protein
MYVARSPAIVTATQRGGTADAAATVAAPAARRSRRLAPVPDETAPPATISTTTRMHTTTARLNKSASPIRSRTGRTAASVTIVISILDGASAGPRRESTNVSPGT